MSTAKDSSTEEKILQAAEQEFIEKGLSGARMQQIADKAGINKALLHYYYRSKDKLFEVIFKTAFQAFFPKFKRIINDDIDLFDKIRGFVNEYITLILKNPNIPIFILHELNSNPDRLSIFFSQINIALQPLKLHINKEVEAGNIRPIEAETLIINIIALCVFPVIAKPIVKVVLFNNDLEAYNLMIEKRKTEVAEFVINSIKIN